MEKIYKQLLAVRCSLIAFSVLSLRRMSMCRNKKQVLRLRPPTEAGGLRSGGQFGFNASFIDWTLACVVESGARGPIECECVESIRITPLLKGFRFVSVLLPQD